ncbi:MAG: serine/threonine-protein kinase [Planctomycetota bacterium]
MSAEDGHAPHAADAGLGDGARGGVGDDDRLADCEDPSDPERDLLIDRLVAAWLRLARAGAAPPIPVYAAAHPDVAEELKQYLFGAALLEGLGDTLRDAADLASGGPDRRGERIGDFRILGVLGRGGMGVVYDALDEKLGRPVALKVLPDGRLSDHRARERFRREAQAAARLQHRCIMPVHGVGETDGQRWYAMQRIDGVGLDLLVRALSPVPDLADVDAGRAALAAELAARLRSGRVEAPERGGHSGSHGSAGVELHGALHANAARIARDAAEALAHAHAEGILHRDVKPSNIMLDRQGRAWVADFGLCKTDEHGSVTAAGDVVGTLRYMPPERFRGVELAAGDVYGLGLVLYELVTQTAAFPDVGRADLVRRVSYEEPPRPGKLARDLPRDLERVIVKAIAKLPEERYGSAEAFARDLNAFLEGRPVSARPMGALYLGRLFVRRNRGLVALAAVALCAFVVATVAYVLGLQRLVRQVGAARAATDVEATRSQLAAATSALRDARFGLARRFLEDIPAQERDWIAEHLEHRARSGGLVFGGGQGRVSQLVELPGAPSEQSRGAAIAVLRGDSIAVHDQADGCLLARVELRGAEQLQRWPGSDALAWISPDGGTVLRWDWRASAHPDASRTSGRASWRSSSTRGAPSSCDERAARGAVRRGR